MVSAATTKTISNTTDKKVETANGKSSNSFPDGGSRPGAQSDNVSSSSISSFLAKDGELEKHLKKKSDSTYNNKTVHDLVIRLQSNLTALRASSYHTTIDCVMRYILAIQEKRDTIPQALFDDALSTYMRSHLDYDCVLGEYLPAGFLDTAHYELSHSWYRNGSHANAAQDWPVFCEIQENQRNTPTSLGPRTGISSLDEALGGLRGLTFLAGDKGTGKTSLALNICVGALRNDPKIGVLLYSFDMPKYRIYQRLQCCVAGIDFRTLSSPAISNADREKLDKANADLLTYILPRIRVVERPAVSPEKGVTKEQLIQDALDLLKTAQVDNILVVFDLFQRMDVETDNTSDLDRDRCRLDAIRGLRAWSRNQEFPEGFPILAISEVRKADYTRRHLTRDDLLGSGALASDADNILLLWPEEERTYHGDSPVSLILRIDKGRDGVERKDLRLFFDHRLCRFDEGPGSSRSGEAASRLTAEGKANRKPPIDPLAGLEKEQVHV